MRVLITGGAGMVGSHINYLNRRIWDNSGRREGEGSKIARELGFKPKTSLNFDIDQTIEWTQSNLGLINIAIDKHNKIK